MNRKRLAKYLVLLIFFILILNFLAGKFYWYSLIWYFDMIMHFLGGFWVGFLALYFFSPKMLSSRSIAIVLFSVLLVGVGWEVFEFIFYNYIATNSFNVLDSLSDIFFDLAGGVFSIIFSLKRIMISDKSELK